MYDYPSPDPNKTFMTDRYMGNVPSDRSVKHPAEQIPIPAGDASNYALPDLIFRMRIDLPRILQKILV